MRKTLDTTAQFLEDTDGIRHTFRLAGIEEMFAEGFVTLVRN